MLIGKPEREKSLLRFKQMNARWDSRAGADLREIKHEGGDQINVRSSRQMSVMDSCEHGNEFSDSTKCEEFVDYYWFFENDFVLRSQLICQSASKFVSAIMNQVAP